MTIESFVITALLGLSVWSTLGTGRLSLAGPGFMAIGTFAALQSSAHAQNPLFAVAAALASSLAAGVLLGYASNRLPAAQAAIATFAFSLVAPAMLMRLGAAHQTAPHAFAMPWPVVCLAASVGALWYLRGSWAFAAGAGAAGLAGALYAHAYSGSPVDSFGIERLGVMIAVAVIGGNGSPLAPLLGTSLLALLARIAAQFTDQALIVDGAALLLALVYLPGGAWPPFETTLRALARWPKKTADGAA